MRFQSSFQKGSGLHNHDWTAADFDEARRIVETGKRSLSRTAAVNLIAKLRERLVEKPAEAPAEKPVRGLRGRRGCTGEESGSGTRES